MSYFIIPIGVILLFLILRYIIRNNNTSPKSIKGQGRIENCCVINPDAKIINIHTNHNNGKSFTIVSFEDGYTFKANLNRRKAFREYNTNNQTYILSDETKQLVMKSAKSQHDKDCYR